MLKPGGNQFFFEFHEMFLMSWITKTRTFLEGIETYAITTHSEIYISLMTHYSVHHQRFFFNFLIFRFHMRIHQHEILIQCMRRWCQLASVQKNVIYMRFITFFLLIFKLFFFYISFFIVFSSIAWWLLRPINESDLKNEIKICAHKISYTFIVFCINYSYGNI